MPFEMAKESSSDTTGGLLLQSQIAACGRRTFRLSLLVAEDESVWGVAILSLEND
jgi:hypothetical protein